MRSRTVGQIIEGRGEAAQQRGMADRRAHDPMYSGAGVCVGARDHAAPAVCARLAPVSEARLGIDLPAIAPDAVGHQILRTDAKGI